MKRVALAVVALIAVLAVIVVARALSQESLQPGAEEPVHLALDTTSLAARFAQAITYPTISNQDRSDIDHAAFLGLPLHAPVHPQHGRTPRVARENAGRRLAATGLNPAARDHLKPAS